MSELRFMSLQNFINYTIFDENKSNQMHPLDIDVKNLTPKELLHYHFYKKKLCVSNRLSLFKNIEFYYVPLFGGEEKIDINKFFLD